LVAQHSHRKVFTDIKDNQSAVLRVSSMMRIVLDNTDSAVHQKTPPASPAKNQRTFKILNPFFPSDAPRTHEPSASANSSVASPVVSPRGAAAVSAHSPPGSPDTVPGTASHRRGTAGSVGSGGDASHGSTVVSHHHSVKDGHTAHRPHHQHSDQHEGHAQAAQAHPKPPAHHGHGRHSPAPAVVLHKQQRPATADLKLVHLEKDILVG
jgi:hypothetical protein